MNFFKKLCCFNEENENDYSMINTENKVYSIKSCIYISDKHWIDKQNEKQIKLVYNALKLRDEIINYSLFYKISKFEQLSIKIFLNAEFNSNYIFEKNNKNIISYIFITFHTNSDRNVFYKEIYTNINNLI